MVLVLRCTTVQDAPEKATLSSNAADEANHTWAINVVQDNIQDATLCWRAAYLLQDSMVVATPVPTQSCIIVPMTCCCHAYLMKKSNWSP